MRRWIVLLSILLGVQVLAAILLLAQQQASPASQARRSLLDFDPAVVDRIVVESPDGKVELVKKKDRWVIPGEPELPADQGQVTALLDRLSAMRAGTVVATSESSHERFRVDDRNFERRITLYQGEQHLASLLVGTSPNFRLVHVRVPGEEAIYAVQFATYEAPDRPREWLDKTLLRRPVEEITAITREGGVTVRREEERFVAEPVPEGKVLDQEAARRLFDNVADQRIDDLLKGEEASRCDQSEPVLRLTVSFREDPDTPVEYRLVRLPLPEDKEGADRFCLTVQGHEERFLVLGYNGQALIDSSDPEVLFQAPEEEKKEPGKGKTEESTGKEAKRP